MLYYVYVENDEIVSYGYTEMNSDLQLSLPENYHRITENQYLQLQNSHEYIPIIEEDRLIDVKMIKK